MQKNHDQAVQVIADKVRQFYERKEKFRIYHGSTNSTRSQHFDRSRVIDTSGLSHVLRIDKEKKVAFVEPNVGMGMLAAETVKFGLIPTVVMEFPGITVGGGFSGTSAESSSFKYGLFEQQVRSIEVVLADGQIVTASDELRADLFHGAAGAFGTLGVITLLEVDLIEAKKTVELSLIPTASVEETIRKIEDAVDAKPAKIDFIDGIIYSPKQGVVMTGRLMDEVPPSASRCSRFTRARDEWFYLECLKEIKASPGKTIIKVIPLLDYLFRYDRGAFWGAKYAFEYFWFPYTRFTRWMLDPFLHTKTMFHALHKSGLADLYIMQDCVFPVSTVKKFIDYCISELRFYPLWLCPLAKTPEFTKHPHSSAIKDDDSQTSKSWLLNVGIWGPGPKGHEEFVAMNREIEGLVRNLGGLKTLYAHSYYTEKEFYEIYDKDQYDALREKYFAGGMPTVYDKVSVDVLRTRRNTSKLKRIRPLGGVYGVLCTIFGSEYLLGKRDR